MTTQRPFLQRLWLIFFAVVVGLLVLFVGYAMYAQIQPRQLEDAHVDGKRLAAYNEVLQAIQPLNPNDRDMTTLSANCAKRVAEIDQILEGFYKTGYLKRQYYIARGKINEESCSSAIRDMKRQKIWEKINWRERTHPSDWRKKLEQLQAEQPFIQPETTMVFADEGLLKIANPWRGMSGCILFQDAAGQINALAGESSIRQELCAQVLANGNPDTSAIDPSRLLKDTQIADLSAVVSDLTNIRNPPKPEPDESKNRPNLLSKDSAGILVGNNVQLTFDLGVQNTAQTLSDCYTGKDCPQKKYLPSVKTSAMYEKAALRMVGVLVMDMASGAILAAGSSHTPCYEQLNNGWKIESGCPQGLGKARYAPERLQNHAIFTDAFPASTVKPILAAAFTANEGKIGDWLNSTLPKSNSIAFLGKLLCQANNFSAQCGNLVQVPMAADMLGWNKACDHNSQFCGYRDLYSGLTLDATNGQVRKPNLYGRIWQERHQDEKTKIEYFRTLRTFLTGMDQARLRGCTTRSYQKCGATGALVNEGYGQGNARATAIGVAGMFAELNASAQGIMQISAPHLVTSIQKPNGDKVPYQIDFHDVKVPQEDAKQIIMALGSTHLSGTANKACSQVAGCGRRQDIRSKTGTATVETETLSAWAKRCDGKSCTPPWKWYVAAYNRSGSGKPDRVVAVLAERNWMTDGDLQDPRDNGVNLAAELALRFIAAEAAPPEANPAEDAAKTE